jgi:serine/threonine-protein kinase RsbW
MVDIVIAAHINNLVDIAAAIRQFLHTIPSLEHDQQAIYAIELAVHELCTNIIMHAYPANDPGSIALSGRFHAHQKKLEINIYDWGRPFSPEKRTLPDLEHGQEGGYGLFIIEQIVDSLHYNRTATSNHWQLIKKIGVVHEHS